MKLSLSTMLGLALLPIAVQAAPRAFEVASIKVTPPPTGGGIRVGISQDNGRITMSGISLRMLVVQAYKIKDPQLVAPEWMDSARFDIVAKLPEGATRDQVPEMLQTLLSDRFKLVMHKESKVLPIYAMVVAKGGLKLKEVETESGLRMRMSPKGREMSGNATLSRLADILSNSMDRPVMDETQLKAVYTIDLTWSPDESDGARLRQGPGPGGPPPGAHEGEKPFDTADAPNIFTALQETMGLKLEPRKSQVDVIVVDSAEKAPTEN